MLKTIALLVPAIRRLHDDRNRIAAIKSSLEAELCRREEEISRLNAVINGYSGLGSRLEELLSQREGSAIDQSGLSGKIDEVLSRTASLEEELRFSVADIRCEHFHIDKAREALARTYRLVTDHPIAYQSDDHIHPRGTRNDNTRSPRFVSAAERIFQRKIRVLELGCAGGGLVLDFLLAGHEAVGVEGSDYSLIWKRAEWANIPNHLFTADITKPFEFIESDQAVKFDLITAWELLEHIDDGSLDGLFENIRRHLSDDGFFVGSVATFDDFDRTTGAIWHVTVKPREWWRERITRAGFEVMAEPFSTADYPRGSGNPRAHDWNASTHPELGFHICFRNPKG